MKCGKCGTQINEGSLVCTGCNTPVAELRLNNLIIENNEGVSIQPTPVVEIAPVVDVVAEPVVEVAPAAVEVVQSPVEVQELPVVEPTPTVDMEVNDLPVIEPTPVVDVVETPVPVVSEVPVSLSENVTNEVVTETVINPVSDNSLQMNVPSNDENIINSVVTDVAPTVTNSEPVGSNEKKSNNVGKFIVLGVFVLVIGLLVGVGAYFFVYSKPVNMFKTTLKELKNNMVSSDGTLIPLKYKFSIQSKLKSNDKELQSLFTNINKFYFEIDSYVDVKNEIADLKLDVKYDNKNMFDVDSYVEKEKAYIKLNGVYDKYISTEVTATGSDDIVSTSKPKEKYDLDVILGGLGEALDVSLKEEYFTKVKKSININNLVVETNANTLVINSSNVGEFTLNMVNSFKSNEKFLVELSKLLEEEKDEVIKSLDELVNKTSNLSKLSKEEREAINYQFTLYTTGLLNDVVGYGVSVDGESANFYFDETYYVLNMTIDGSEEKVFDAKVISEGKYELTVYIDENPYTLEVGVEYTENPSYTKPNVSSSVKLDELTDDDKNNITIGLLESDGVKAFMTDFKPIIDAFSALLGDGFGEVVEPELDNGDLEVIE